MEKRTPHCPLSKIKELIADQKVSYTKSALLVADALGFDRQGIRTEILKLERSEFYKSMMTYHDAKIWQDVSHHKTSIEMLYVK